MKYDGIVIKVDNLYLFILDPDTNEIRDGINISNHKCYDDLKKDQLMVVNVTFKDGTQDIEKIDLDEFIYGDSYGSHDTFLYIYDVLMFSINNDNTKDLSIVDIINKGELNDIAISCIETSKKITKSKKDE